MAKKITEKEDGTPIAVELKPDNAWKVAAINLIMTGIVTICMGILQYLTLQAANNASMTSRQALFKVNATNLEVKQVKETGVATYALVNSGSLENLELHLVTAKLLVQESSDPMHKETVALIEKKIADHKEKMKKEEAEKKQNREEDRQDAREDAKAKLE